MCIRDRSSTVERIDQSLYFVEKGNKKFLLPWLIKNLRCV